MIFSAGLLTGFCLGVVALWIFLELIALAARRRVPPPTMHHRLPKTRREPPPMPQVKPAAPQQEVPHPPLYMYGVTGLEDE